MKHRTAVFVLFSVSLLTFQCSSKQAPSPTIRVEARNPWNHLSFSERPENFEFAIVADRGGGHRPGVFSNAIDRLRALNPSFVMSVGDLLDTRDFRSNPDLIDERVVEERWAEFDAIVKDLPMPFFYVAGNNDLRNTEMEGIWHRRLGRTYYGFLYRDVLFIVLNSEDPPGSQNGMIGDAQLEWLGHELMEHESVRWTFVFLHRPLWLYPEHPSWKRVEDLLGQRARTVFAGHHHRYTKSVVNGHDYYGLATTGGSSTLSGQAEGRFDHLVWVTMSDEGPRVLNLMLEGLWGDDPARESLH